MNDEFPQVEEPKTRIWLEGDWICCQREGYAKIMTPQTSLRGIATMVAACAGDDIELSPEAEQLLINLGYEIVH